VIQIFSGAAFLPVLWVLFGYSLTLGTNPGNGFIGDFSKVLWIGVHFDDCFGATVIPEALYALFQMMFATITPLLLTGAYAERLAFRPYLIFTVLWEILVYYPVAHWMWSTSGWLNKMGAQDFAGGIVIHITAGVSALVAAVMLGQRRDFHKHHGEAPYSSLPLTSIGATMLWTGWFGFNGGSALMAGRGAVHAVTNSQIAASVCSSCFLFYTMLRTGRASLLQCINGAIAGLAGVTPASGFIDVPSAFVLGILLFAAAQGSIWILKHKLRIDDALDVSSVHGVPGLVGAVYIGFCGSSSISGADGLLYGGGGHLLGVQLLASLVVAAWTAVMTFFIFKIISRFYPLRVDEQGEILGLDHHQHDEPSFQADTTDHHHHHHASASALAYASAGGPMPTTRASNVSRRSVGPRATFGTFGGGTLNASIAAVIRREIVTGGEGGATGSGDGGDTTVLVVNQEGGMLDTVDVDEDPRRTFDSDDEEDIRRTRTSSRMSTGGAAGPTTQVPLIQS